MVLVVANTEPGPARVRALSWFVNNYASLTEWRATVERLTGFTRAVATAKRADGGPACRH